MLIGASSTANVHRVMHGVLGVAEDGRVLPSLALAKLPAAR